MLSLIEDYSQMEFLDIGHGTIWRASVCFIEYDEFDILRQLNDDERVNYALFNHRLPFAGEVIKLPKTQIVSDNFDNVIEPTFHISAFPNPVRNSNVTVELNNFDIKRPNLLPVVKIFNIKGQLLKASSMENKVYVWDRKDTNGREVSSGIYFIKVTDNDISQTKKIIITK